MKLTFGQKAAAWAVVQALFAGCSADTGKTSPRAPAPPPPPPPPAVISPTISAQPNGATLLTGATATFSVTAKGTSVSYQWQKNGAAIPGATASSYQTPAAVWSDDGAQYMVVVSNSAGSVTSTAATEHLELSSDQQKHESFALAPASGSYEAMWNLNLSGAESAATNYMAYDYAVETLSPLTHGPQAVAQQPPVNLTKNLPLPGASVSRVLKNGVVLVVPGAENTTVTTYVGSSVQVDDLAADNKTVAYSQIRSNYTVVPLTGLLHDAPTEFTHPYNAIFQNAGTLDTTTSWAAGAAYLRFTAKNLGDRYNVVDCTTNSTTLGTTPNPCNTGTTLAAAMAAGETSSSDATTYHTADGLMGVVGGVNIWIANQPRPVSGTGTSTTEYRIYFELNGNVYTGNLVRDGATLGGFRYRAVIGDPSTDVFFDYVVRMNGAAAQSLASGSLL